MLPGLRDDRWKVLAAAVFMLAALFVGFAHRPLAIAQRPAPVDMTAYALPDGTLPEVCLGADGGGDGSSHGRASSCDACVLSAAPGLLLADAGFVAAPGFRRIRIVPPPQRAVDARVSQAASARAPPHSAGLT